MRSPALGVFFLSGAATLLYQVVWQRMLAIFAGVDTYAVTLIVAAFMAGLGSGAVAGGRVADRVERSTNLLLFAGAEITLGIFGAMSAWLYYDVLFVQFGEFNLPLAATGGILFGALFCPTFLMGASLPLLARVETERLIVAPLRIGRVYAANTLGAAVGAASTTWIIVPLFGLEGSLRIGVILNAGCAAAALVLAYRALRTANAARNARPPGTNRPAARTGSLRWWIATCAVSGFVALAYEIAWLRLFSVMLRSAAPFTFGSLLALYLAGLGVGALAAARPALQASRPARVFVGLHAAAGILAAGGLAALTLFAAEIGARRNSFMSAEPVNETARALQQALFHGVELPAHVPAAFLLLYVAIPALTILPVTCLLGATYPFLQRAVQVDTAAVGQRVGLLYLAGALGSTAGALATGWVLLDVIGTARTVVAAAALSTLPLAFVPALDPSDPIQFSWGRKAAIAAVVVMLSLSVIPEGNRLWAGLHGTTPERLLLVEGATGVTAIRAANEGFSGPKMVIINGEEHSDIPYGDVHTALGALPVLLHPNPRNVAIIGLGGGGTAYAASAVPETNRITVVEIMSDQLSLLHELARRDPYPALRAILRDPRIEHVRGGGREYLLRQRRLFDIIETDPLPPRSEYAGNLYSVEFFSLVKNRLKPGGMAVSWAGSHRVRDTFVGVFPYVLGMDMVLIGSADPIEAHRGRLAARVADPLVQEHFRRANIDIRALVASYLDAVSVRSGPWTDRSDLTDVNTDLVPRDEFEYRPEVP